MESVGTSARLLIGGSGDSGQSATAVLLFSVLLLTMTCCGVQSCCHHFQVDCDFLSLLQLLAPPSHSPRRMLIGPVVVCSTIVEPTSLAPSPFLTFLSLSLSLSSRCRLRRPSVTGRPGGPVVVVVVGGSLEWERRLERWLSKNSALRW